jgi:hypothetical protein
VYLKGLGINFINVSLSAALKILEITVFLKKQNKFQNGDFSILAIILPFLTLIEQYFPE